MIPTAASRKFVRFAAAVLAFNIAVVLWGAFVRASGSGAGCGNHWPLCNGVVVPQAPAMATLIEFTHRASSGIDVLLVALLVAWAFRLFPRGHLARTGAVLSAVFLATEALIGAALVKLEHVARNASVGRAYSLSTHLINTLTLLACLTLTVWWAAGRPGLRLRGRAAVLAIAGVLLFVFAGIGGAIAALGDTLFPVASLAAGMRQDLDPAANLFVRLRVLHPVLAVTAAGWLIFFAEWAVRRVPGARQWARLLQVAVGLQILLGVTNWILLAPVGMQLVHLLVADLVWIALVLLCAVTLQDVPVLADSLSGEMVPHPLRFERAGAKQP